MIFNTIFDHIYVLNLKKSLDRREHIEKEFKKVGIIKYDFFEAVPYDSDEAKNMIQSNMVKKFPNCFKCNYSRCDCENNYLTPFQIANWCSFLNIFKDIIKKDYKFVLICEDDIVFTFQHKRIINKLLSKDNFRKYKINMNLPLLIRMGATFNPQNHNSKADPFFLKNYALTNPCFAINKEMAMIYLKNITYIDNTSDVYFHQKIPKYIKGIQNFTMHPYPIYELSFKKSIQKFESLIRPKNGLRRIEYKDFLFLTSNNLLTIFIKNIVKILKLDIEVDNIGYNGTINYLIQLNDDEINRYYFHYKILLIDDYYDDIKIIYFNITNKIDSITNIYQLYLNKIKIKYDIHIDFNNDKLLESVILFYEYLLKLLNIENIIKININNENEINKLSDMLKISINKNIDDYLYYKNVVLENNKISNYDIKTMNDIETKNELLII
jgi:GR25 family glycosyltransferase involved in LPS biosynthesis